MKRKATVKFPTVLYVQEVRDAKYEGWTAHADIQDAAEADLCYNTAGEHVAIYRLESVGRIHTPKSEYVEAKKAKR